MPVTPTISFSTNLIPSIPTLHLERSSEVIRSLLADFRSAPPGDRFSAITFKPSSPIGFCASLIDVNGITLGMEISPFPSSTLPNLAFLSPSASTIASKRVWASSINFVRIPATLGPILQEQSDNEETRGGFSALSSSRASVSFFCAKGESSIGFSERLIERNVPWTSFNAALRSKETFPTLSPEATHSKFVTPLDIAMRSPPIVTGTPLNISMRISISWNDKGRPLRTRGEAGDPRGASRWDRIFTFGLCRSILHW
mmetsp:Transcript_4353/g.10195  ORF Transcript_4353/g.10195 Transcript_4353/m.10195 type:complete len:257 (-) Transcript_4353:2770-3540(-)